MKVITGRLDKCVVFEGNKTIVQVVSRGPTSHRREITEPLEMSRKAMWAVLRAVFTNRINDTIKEKKEALRARRAAQGEKLTPAAWRKEFDKFFSMKIRSVTDQRQLQYIVDEKGKVIVAAATKKHSLMTSNEVYQIISSTVVKLGYQTEMEPGILGRIVFIKRTKWADFGIQIHAGDIKTMKAISMSLFIQAKGMGVSVDMPHGCLNPLSFMNLNRDLIHRLMPKIKQISACSRILRFEQKTQISTRIEQVITEMAPMIAEVEEGLEKPETKFPKTNHREAKTILSSMAGAYGLGAKVIQHCLDRFDIQNKNNMLGLAMATSWVVKHNPKVFRKNSETNKQNLADVSGALLFIEDTKSAVDACKAYMAMEKTANTHAKEVFARVR